MVSQSDAHAMKLLDLPLALRLKQNAIVLHSELGLIEDARGQYSALLSNIVFPRGLHTLLAQVDNKDVVGQFRYRQGEANAHLVYLAPTLAESESDTIWLHMLDSMAEQAGRSGAQTLVGEVDLKHRLFETMRQSGYAVYSRQVVWQRGPLAGGVARSTLTVKPEAQGDDIGIAALLGCTIPRIMQSVMGPSPDMQGLVYRRDGQIEAYLAYSEGKHGVYLLPFVHPEVLSEAPDILAAAMQNIDRCRKLPIYILRARVSGLAGERGARLGLRTHAGAGGDGQASDGGRAAGIIRAGGHQRARSAEGGRQPAYGQGQRRSGKGAGDACSAV